MPYYLQLDAADIVMAATETAGTIEDPAMIAVDGLRSDLIGRRYDREVSTPEAPVFVAVPAEPEPAPVWEWYIDHGPLTDRLGAAAAAIDLSVIPGVVAVRSDFGRRKWIDLKDLRVIAAFRYLAGQPHPVLGTLEQPLITVDVANVALNTLPTSADNLALRKLYFS